MRSQEAVKQLGLTATGATFSLDGGTYLIVAVFHNPSALSCGLQILGPDGATFVDLTGTDLAHTNGSIPMQFLPPGQYQFVVSGTPGTGETVDIVIARVPYE